MKYDWLIIKEQIIKKGQELNIDKIGFTSGEPFFAIKDILESHQQRGYSSGFEEKDINLRLLPQLSLPEVQSIIAIAVAYPNQAPTGEPGDSWCFGKFCRASWGTDYHQVLKNKLELLARYIKNLVPEAHTLAMVDTGPLSDRAVAYRAGLGWIGKNSSLITPEYGSFVYLGQLLTNLPLPSDQPLKEQCGQCERCLTACPTAAIVPNEKTIDCQKCLAYQTLNKGFLEREIKGKIAENQYIYGCDNCQLVCPHNFAKTNDWHQEFTPQYQLINPCLKSLLQISNKEFKNTFGHMSGSWRGKKALQRNGILIMGKIRDKQFVPLLTDILHNDPRPEIRGAALWSLSQYNSPEIQQIIKKALKVERDERVRALLEKFIESDWPAR